MRATGRVPAGALRDLVDRWSNRELAGMPPELLRVFSKRADAIDGEVERLEAEGRVRTPRLVKWAVHSTRPAMRHEAPATLVERCAGALTGTLTHGAGPRLAGPRRPRLLGETPMECSG